MNTKKAFLMGLIGVLPDIDAVLRIHKSPAHSLLVLFLIATPLVLLVYKYSRSHVGTALLAVLIYALHIVLDMFTRFTPVLWPLGDSVMIKAQVEILLSTSSLAITPSISILTEKPDFTQKSVIEGRPVSETGIIVTIITITVILLDVIKSQKTQQKQ